MKKRKSEYKKLGGDRKNEKRKGKKKSDGIGDLLGVVGEYK